MRKKSKLVFGVGLNDADYPVNPRVNGKIVPCPFYQRWCDMLCRAYSERLKVSYPTYRGVSVCEEWHTFSNFKFWMEQQDWEGKQLDKDILYPGNKIYSPNTCVFVPSALNQFLTDCRSARGCYPIGVSFHSRKGKFEAKCRTGAGKRTFLGFFDTPEEAHKAWLTEKRKQARILASQQSDSRIAEALIKRYEDFNETNH